MRNNIKIRKNRHRNIALLVVGLFVTLTLLSGLPMEQWWAQHMHKLSAAHEKIVGDVNPQLAQKLTYNAEKETFQFNSEAQPVDKDTDPSEMTAEKLRHIAGSEEEQSKLYSLDVARDGSKGITFYETNLELSFTLKPKFDVGRGYELDDRLVYPMEKAKAVYTVKGNGLKEDILYDAAPRDGLATHTYNLELPKELEARLHDDGSVGIYSADPVLFGNMSFGGEGDKLKIINARQTANKDHLVFSIPKPIIVTESGETDKAKAWFELDDTTLTLNARDLNAIDGPFSIDPTVVVTSSSDFQEGGNNEYNTGFGADEIYRDGLSGGSVGTWQNGKYEARANHALVVFNDHIYLTGGQADDVYSDSVEYAPIGTNGRVGTWNSTTSFNRGRNRNTSVAYNGYLYVLGGNENSSLLNDVQYAPINADGTVGSWSTTTSFTDGRYNHASVVHNGYLYVIGGDGGADLNDVQYAPLNGDGTVGAWSATTSFSTARRSHTSVVHNDYLYVIGGSSGSNTKYNDVQYAPINADGTVGSWSTTTSFSTPRDEHTSVVHNGYLYVMGGHDSDDTNNTCSGGTDDFRCNDVQYAPINADGTVGTWNTTTSFSTARNRHTSFAYSSSDNIYVIGGLDDGSTGRLNDTQHAPINGDGTVGSWSIATSFTNGRNSHTSVVYNGYLYVIGGYDGSDRVNDVQYAPINADGTVGIWSTTTSFSTTRDDHTSVVYNGYLYVMGGYDVSSLSHLNDVQYAPINADGTVGSWTATTSFPTTRGDHTSVVYNGYLYVIGGYSSGSHLNDVQYAPINADGTVGSWTATTSFTNGRNNHTSVVHNGYLYVIGGSSSGSSYLSDVQYAPINADGTVGSWTATTSFTNGRNSHTSVVHNGYLYVIGGYDSSNLSDVQYAPINADGTVGSWATTTSFVGDHYRHASVVYNGYLYVIGGRGSSYLSDVLYSKIDLPGVTTNYSATTDLPEYSYSCGLLCTANSRTLARHASVAHNGYIYILGGSREDDGTRVATNTVYYAPVNNDGSLGSWSSTSNFSTARYDHASVVHNGYLYILGGYDGSGYANDVQYAPINSDGTVGTWNTTSSFTTARRWHSSITVNNYVYIIGGYDDNILNDVQYAPISANGTVGSWSTTATLDTARYSHASIAANGHIYAVGGYSNVGSGFQDSVEYAPINADGTVGSWSYATSFITARSDLSSVVHNGNLYVVGGRSSTGGENDVQYAPINSDGTLGPWNATTSFTTGRSSHTSVAYNGYLYVVGGDDGSNYLDDVQYAQINNGGPGTTDTYSATSSFTTGRSRHASVVYNDYIYVLGGYDGTRFNDVQYAPLNADGTVGSWSATTSFSTARYWHTANVHDGYLYVLGGSSSSGAINDVQYAPLNADGTVGSWSATTSFSTARYGHTSVIHNGYMYVLGGGSYRSDVQYAPINANGTIGTWNTATSFNTGRRWHASVFAGDYLYILGGYDGSNYLDDVEYAPINADGTVGNWSATTSFSGVRQQLDAVAVNGYLYISGGIDASSRFDDVQYAPIESAGTLGVWKNATSFSNVRGDHTSAYANGFHYVLGGYDGSSYFNDVQYAAVDVIARKAQYSKLVDLGAERTITDITYNTADGSDIELYYRVAGESGAFGSLNPAFVLDGSCGSAELGRYIQVAVVINDKRQGVFLDSKLGTLTDFTVHYAATTGSVPTEKRLHHGKYFDQQVLQPLDTLKLEGVTGC